MSQSYIIWVVMNLHQSGICERGAYALWEKAPGIFSELIPRLRNGSGITRNCVGIEKERIPTVNLDFLVFNKNQNCYGTDIWYGTGSECDKEFLRNRYLNGVVPELDTKYGTDTEHKFGIDTNSGPDSKPIRNNKFGINTKSEMQILNMELIRNTNSKLILNTNSELILSHLEYGTWG